MPIMLDERRRAEDTMRSHTIGNNPFETLSAVARYYLDDGVPRRKVRKLMELFLCQCDPIISIPKWSDTIANALDAAAKRETIHIDDIAISSSELEKIAGLRTSQLRRLAFTLLCLSKYWDTVNPKSDHWVNTKDSEIMHMANIPPNSSDIAE